MKTRGDFLLEIGCEEIPAGQIPRACSELQEILEKYLSTHGLLGENPIEAWGAPRRLGAATRGILLRQPDSIREILGPPKSIAFDTVGAPTRAAESFAARQGVPTTKLVIINTPKGEYLAVRQVVRGRSAREILCEILPQAIREISFPKTMSWPGSEGLRFARPIQWIVALLNGAVVPFVVAGVRSSRHTAGHRFLGSQRIPVNGAKDYFTKLRRNFILADPEERQKKIDKELQGLSARSGWRVHRDPDLLTAVVYLTEWPSVILGDFAKAYLDLPDEILITVMRDHQKYFAVERKDGKLEAHFLAVINLDQDRKGLVRAGHERVLRARLADAQFFWRTDQKRRLADYLPKLARVTYETRLGSYLDKVNRLRALARWVAGQWFDAGAHLADVHAADRAAELSKCDLATEMVREFPELQGIVGGLYALEQGESEEVAWAVYDHYRPAGLEDSIPRNLTGCALAIADKLDSLAGCFAVGAIPSGSSDPFALRRAAFGIVQVLLERKLPLSISAAVSAAVKGLAEHPPHLAAPAGTEKQVIEFIAERARYVLRERQGFAYDEINAAFAAGGDDLIDLLRRVEALKAIRNTKNFLPLAIAFKRIRKILEKAGTQTPGAASRDGGVRPELFTENAERELHRAAMRAAERAGAHKRAGRYREALETIAELQPTVDQFFDDVLVMAEDPEVRRNRLHLLSRLLREFSTIADFSEMVPEESS